jgi:hypothetical protein
MFKGEMPGTGFCHASCTTVLNPGILGQKFSNRKEPLDLGIDCWQRSKRQ